MTLPDLASELGELAQRGLRRQLRTVTTPAGPQVDLNGQLVTNFSSNNYLGLASDPRLVEAAIAGLHIAGVGASASRLIVGNHQLHRRLESELATYHDAPSALLFNSGYNANVGTLQALGRAGDTIYSDAHNHASLIDGCRLSRADVRVFPHSDVETLRAMMRESDRTSGRRLVVTDSVFSMDGDRAPLTELADLCQRMDAALVVDEAHAMGVLGPQGRGLGAALGVPVDVHIATFGKSFGGFGAYVAGSTELTEVLLNRARSFIFTTGLPPSVAAASLAALDIIRGASGDVLRERLAGLIERFASGLQELGLLAAGAGSTAIFPILIGDAKQTMACCEALLERGLYAQGIRSPTVAPGTARLRFALMATHTEDDIDAALHALAELVTQEWIPRIEVSR